MKTLHGTCHVVKFVNSATAELTNFEFYAILLQDLFLKPKCGIKFSSKKRPHKRYKFIHKSHPQILILQNKICLQKSTKPFLCFLCTTHK